VSLNRINQLIFVTVKCCVFSAVRAVLLNVVQTSFGFKGLGECYITCVESVAMIYSSFVGCTSVLQNFSYIFKLC
jgi:hypothetical protein